jgi:hypothetical protein
MSTITPLNLNDNGSTSRNVINDNFETLNEEKLEAAGAATLEDKTIDADENTISNLEVDNFKSSVIVTHAEGIVANNNDTTIPTSSAVKAYVDEGGTPMYVAQLTANLPTGLRFADDYNKVWVGNGATNTTLLASTTTGGRKSRLVTLDWADADRCIGFGVVGGQVYMLLQDQGTTPDANRLYRVAESDWFAGVAGTQINFSGSNPLIATDTYVYFTTYDGVTFYFTHLAGNSANAYDISKYTLSGTTLTYQSTVSIPSSATINGIVVDSLGNIYAVDASAVIRKYNSAGILQKTTDAYSQTTITSFKGVVYIPSASSSSPGWIRAYVN